MCWLKKYYIYLIEELSADQWSISSADWRIICRPKIYLEIEKLFAEQKVICRLKKYLICISTNYLQIKKIRRSKPKKYSNCRLKNFLKVDEVFHLQIEERSADWTIIYIVKELCADQRSIWISKNYFFVKELSTDLRTICRSKAYLQIKELFSASWRSVDQSIWYVNGISADWRVICLSKFFLEIVLQSADSSSIFR